MEVSQHVFKILAAGDAGSGKSCLVTRFTSGTYDNTYSATIGVDFRVRILNNADFSRDNITDLPASATIKLQIWDIAGHDRFHTIVQTYYRSMNAVLLIFDLGNRTSFTRLLTWYTAIKRSCFPRPRYYLIGAKSDTEPEITRAEIDSFCALISDEMSSSDDGALSKADPIPYYECSSKNNTGVDEMFTAIAADLLRKKGFIAPMDVSSVIKPQSHERRQWLNCCVIM